MKNSSGIGRKKRTDFLLVSLIDMPEENQLFMSEDSRATPEWINAEYFKTVLQKCKNDLTIEVQAVRVRYALPKGENFASVIYRAQVVYRRSGEPVITSSYILKGVAESPVARQKLGEYDVHGKEMDVYQLVIPELMRLMKSVGELSELYPDALCVDRSHEMIILNDVLQEGFVMVDRTKGLDATHTKMSLKAMAKLHAGSLKLVERYPTIFDRYTTGMMNRKTDAFHLFFQSTYDALMDEIYSWNPEWHYYANKLAKLRPHYLEQGMTVFDNDSADDLRVFVHGDFWVNNLMFKYDARGVPIDMLVLDFQYCCYGSPAIDLCYFFFTSSCDEIRQNSFDEYMQYYYYQLAKYVKKLNCSIRFPTLHQFQQQIMKKMFYSVHSSIVALPLHLNELAEDADLETLLAGDERSRRFKRAIMTNVNYQKIIKGLLPTFDRKGLLDKLD
ncbi:uncharacterized protein LOC109422703 [Aedes albopictus]|uniref:CHK kinase-like domain-containing protein n=1 Tax=Aedes albopictus TaxID=7160 RepID=A0ABM2A3M7_AEDAL|nr:uncharacterized protein LOC109422703 [Aedes albopictus]